MLLHQGEELLKVDKAVPVLQYRIINYQTGIGLRRTPTGFGKCPFNIEDERHSPEEVLSNIKILRRQFGVNIDDLFRG